MSQKINVTAIVAGHLSTLRDANTEKTSPVDLATFYALPAALALLGAAFHLDLNGDVVNVIVTASAIFTGLLLNLLLLVYDQKSHLAPVNSDEDGWEKKQTRHTILSELYYNISYAILVSLFILVISLVHLAIYEMNSLVDIAIFGLSFNLDYSAIFTSVGLVFLGMNLLLTIFMVLKRIYSLLQDGT